MPHVARHATKPPLDPPSVKPPASKIRTVAKWTGISVGGLVAVSIVANAISPPKPVCDNHPPAPRVTHSTPVKAATAQTVTVKPVTAKPVTAKPPAAKPALAANATPADCPALTSWANGGGTGEMATVQTDLTQVQNDALAQNMPALVGDGTQLASDAGSALNDPPPVASIATPYKAAMSDLVRAGNLASEDNVMVLPLANSYVQQATPENIAITSALQASGCSNLL
jgi:hypothetical protein